MINQMNCSASFQSCLVVSPQEKNKEGVLDRIVSVFGRVIDQLVHFFARLGSSSTRQAIFEGNIIEKPSNTANVRKIEDAALYAGLQKRPLTLSEKGKQIFETRKVPGADTVQIAPESRSGKCFGASLYFIADYLRSGCNIRATAGKFEDGVPAEGVLLQEVAQECFARAPKDLAQENTEIPVAYQIACDFEDLQVERSLGHQVGLQTIREKVKTLEPGAYLLCMPFQRRGCHFVTLIVEASPSALTYLYDSISGVGWSHGNQARQAMVDRVLKKYAENSPSEQYSLHKIGQKER
jgi:hypothetical protein